ncbi:MAG TPA: FAD-linked oxidase C-terminal domain-containing protein [Gemmataceae bacterium]|jgi:FAD/FMN-containing dehydrogenase/Fe-S oxidoreductase|nr:FAD-linked oxidase C-terminal domain-containing protein [Gemmataceae bacterium]
MSDFTELKRDALARYLRRHLQGEVRFDPMSRRLYSTDASIYQIEPLGVVIPRTVADVQTTVQVAGEMRIPITARGGGTSLSGQSIGPGVVLDCSKYLNTILDIDATGRVARIQPGVVLDQLNAALAPHGLQFGPEVATASRANLGGMIGNNSAGSRSILYGKTIDHVRRLGVLLSDGSRAEFGPVSPAEWDRRAAKPSLEGAAYRGVRQVVRDTAAEIRRRFPRIQRRVSGYNLDVFCPAGNGQAASRQPIGLEKLIVGSEGTLAVVTEAEVGLVPRPKARGLLVAHFASLSAAMDALAACLEFGPSAVELLDQMLIDLARNNLSLKDTMAAIRGRPAALFMVEFSGDEAAEVADRVERLRLRLGEAAGVTAAVPALEPAQRDPLWSLRSAALPLLLGLPGDRKPVTFVEDTAVPPERLPEFVARFQDVLQRHGTDGAFYGHASVGCLHIRPLLNLKDPADVSRMRRITEAVTDLVLEFGGALSGEHGDGLARSEWNRKMFGDAVYGAFRQVKHAFDPHNLLNPGKVVEAPAMTENLRYAPGYAPAEPETVFDYSRQEGFVRSIELCNGSGVCRKLQGGTMCPSFRATRDEKDSTRGRANALRLALAGEQPLKALRGRDVYDVLDLCLMCKACKAECPSNVDMAKLKAEFLHLYYKDRSRPLGQWLMAHIDRLNRFGAPAAPLVNWLQRRGLVRWLMEKAAGIDRRRSLPRLHRDHFRRWFARHTPPGVHTPGSPAGRYGRVVLLDDCFTTFNEPDIGRAAVLVLEGAGYQVELAGLACCCRPMISKGFLSESRELIGSQLLGLARRLADGVPLLGLEPSCLLTLADEWPELVPSDESRCIAAAARLADAWLAGQEKAGRCDLRLAPLPAKCLVHGHCHQKALLGVGGTVAALRLVPELEVSALQTGCCGMAGSFGFEKEHYDVSVAVANLDLLPALAADPKAVVAAPGTSCRHQIHDLAARRALHPLEILARQAEK